MAHHAQTVLAFLLLLALALFISTGDGAVNFGYPAKCFFTVSKSAAGAWWFVDPLGKPFLSLGVTSVSYWGDTSTTGATPYHTAVATKFNNNQSAWADSAVERLTSWKLNTLGAWADTTVITKGMPYTRVVGFGEGLFPDVFDPAWEARTLVKAKAACEPLRNDPNLIGYFLDNELMWGKTLQGWTNGRFTGTLLDQFLVGYNKTAPGTIKAVNFLKAKYPTVQALNTAWNTNYTSFSAINTFPSIETSAHVNDSAAFTYIAAVQFFNVSRNSIRKYDTNHLLLGVKFAGAPSVPVIKACGEYNEVVSLDYYPSSYEPLPNLNFFSQVFDAAKRPLLVGEFAFRGNDVGLPNTKGAGLVVATQAMRAEGYKNFTTILAKLPYIVGLHWFEWFDEPAEGRALDGENSNYGLVNINDETYTALTNQMKITNPLLSTVHEAGQPTGLSSAKCVSSLSCLNKCSNHGCCNINTGNCVCNTGFSGVDCSLDSSKLQVTSFGSSLDSSLWTTTEQGGWGSQAFSSAQVSTGSNQLRLAISPCTASCSGKNFTSGGAITVSNSYGYGIYTAQMQAPQRKGFVVQLELNSRSDPRESFTLHVKGNESVAALDYYGKSQFQYLKYVSPLPFANPSAAFHNYSIHYMPTYFAFYADNVLLGYYNSSLVSYGLPSRPMAVWLYVTATDTSPKVSDAAYVKSVTYQLVGGTTATCPSSANSADVSAASRSLPSIIAPLVSAVFSFAASNSHS